MYIYVRGCVCVCVRLCVCVCACAVDIDTHTNPLSAARVADSRGGPRVGLGNSGFLSCACCSGDALRFWLFWRRNLDARFAATSAKMHSVGVD
jgi:hypothetical protein